MNLSLYLEHYETPEWAVERILDKEPPSMFVIDPCTGTGVLANAAKRRGYNVKAYDIHDWGYPGTIVNDWLGDPFPVPRPLTVLMNPPFSKAVEFVQRALELKPRKIVCFQRFSWWESRTRRCFFDEHPPARVYVCGDRADCWRHDIPHTERDGRSGPTAHAWFVWDRFATIPGTQLGHIWKDRR